MQQLNVGVEFNYSPDFWAAAIESAEEVVEIVLPLTRKIHTDDLSTVARCIDFSPPDQLEKPIVDLFF